MRLTGFDIFVVMLPFSFLSLITGYSQSNIGIRPCSSLPRFSGLAFSH